MSSPLTGCPYRDHAHSRQHFVDYEQGLQKRLSRVVCSYVNRAAPRKNSAARLTRPRRRFVGRTRQKITLAAGPSNRGSASVGPAPKFVAVLAHLSGFTPKRRRRRRRLRCLLCAKSRHQFGLELEDASTLYAAIGRRMPFRLNSPTGSTVTAFSTACRTRGLIRI